MLLQLFLTFLKIGLFTFGGGYAMISLIQNEVVYNHAWITQQEFADILAISQLTPGPVGINTATYTGYTAMIHAGYTTPMAMLGACMASCAVILFPVLLMWMVTRWLGRHGSHPAVKGMMFALRLVVIGIIASAAVALVNVDTFGKLGINRQFVVSLILFAVVFFCSLLPREWQFQWRGRSVTLRRPSPIILLLVCGVLGGVVYAL